MVDDGGIVAGEPPDLDRIADALEGATDRLRERNDHLADIRDGISALAEGTSALMLAVQGNAARNRQFRWQMLGIGVLALILIVAALFISSSNHSVATKIASCTTPPTATSPGGACYRDGQARTSAAVALLEEQFTRAAAATAVCARESTEYDRVLACVQRLVATSR